MHKFPYYDTTIHHDKKNVQKNHLTTIQRNVQSKCTKRLSKYEPKSFSSGMFLDCPSSKYTKQHGKVTMHIEHKRYSVWIVKILKFSIIRSKIFLYIFSLLKLSELILSYARWCYCVFLSILYVCACLCAFRIVRVDCVLYIISITW